jgi:hypothetical protein
MIIASYACGQELEPYYYLLIYGEMFFCLCSDMEPERGKDFHSLKKEQSMFCAAAS